MPPDLIRNGPRGRDPGDRDGSRREIAVHLGLSNGRLVPPPSVIFATFADLSRAGE